MNGRIEICGGIASGKTTLAKLLRTLGATPILENFAANPFWRAFCSEPAPNAFETELCFLLQHYHDIRTGSAPRPVCDFSLLLDVAYSRVTLDDRARACFDSVLEEARRRVGPPEFLIYLRCDPNVQLARIRSRCRVEEKPIGVDYLRSLNMAVDQVVSESSSVPTRLLVIDSASRDFATDALGIAETLSNVRQAFFES